MIQTLKDSLGDDKWLEFFKLVSIAFADLESGKISINADTDDRQKLREMTRDLAVIEKLNAFAVSVEHFSSTTEHIADYYLLMLESFS